VLLPFGAFSTPNGKIATLTMVEKLGNTISAMTLRIMTLSVLTLSIMTLTKITQTAHQYKGGILYK
jgi:hypothetical protein